MKSTFPFLSRLHLFPVFILSFSLPHTVDHLPTLRENMPFFKDFRRRSKVPSSVTAKSSESQFNGERASAKSSLSPDASSYTSVTPPPSIKPNTSSSNLRSLSEPNGGVNGTKSSTSLPVPQSRSAPAVNAKRSTNYFVCHT